MRQKKSDGNGNHFRALKNTSLRSRVSEILRESIFSGKLQSGDPLKEIQLARQFQVSQSTVRESLLQLEHDGLVVRVPNRETRVTKLSTKEVCERLVLRSLLEELAGVEASRRMKEGDFRILEQECEKLSRALEGNDYYKAAQADLSFHRFIWKQSGNQTLYSVLDRLMTAVFAFVSILQSYQQTNLEDVVSPHMEIITAIRKGDRELIRVTMCCHIETFYGELMELELSNPPVRDLGQGLSFVDKGGVADQ